MKQAIIHRFIGGTGKEVKIRTFSRRFTPAQVALNANWGSGFIRLLQKAAADQASHVPPLFMLPTISYLTTRFRKKSYQKHQVKQKDIRRLPISERRAGGYYILYLLSVYNYKNL